MTEDDECCFCDKAATGEATVISQEDGCQYYIRTCDECSKPFDAPPGTVVAMPLPMLPPDRRN
jgi:hypothetical protein